MKWTPRLSCCALALALLPGPAAAQEPEAGPGGPPRAATTAARMATAPGEPHAGLARGAGRWKTTTRMWVTPGEPPVVWPGSTEREMILGGRVLAETAGADIMGVPYEGRGQMGYDNVSGWYWSTWTDNLSTGCFVARGRRDAAGDSLTFRGEYPDLLTGLRVRVRSVIRWQDQDTQVFEWHETRDGIETQTMEITYQRLAL